MNLPASRVRWPLWALELWAERAAIMEFQGNLSRDTAEFRAEEDVRKGAWALDREGKERIGV